MEKTTSQSDWEIGQLYSTAWTHIKKHKVLWLFGIFAGASSSFNFNSSRSLDTKDIEKFKDFIPHTPSKEAALDVLGAATSPLQEVLNHIVSGIPSYFYFILGLEIFLLVAIGVVIAFIAKAWGQAALLEGVQTSLADQTPSIAEVSQKAFTHIRPLLWLSVVPPLVISLGFILIALFGMVLFFVPNGFVKLIIGIAMVIGVIALIWASVSLTFAQIWAPRLVVVDKKMGKDALFTGHNIARKKFWAMVLLGIVNAIAGFFLFGVPVAIVAGIFVGGIFAHGTNGTLGVSLIIISGTIFILLILAYSLFGGIWEAFKTLVWSKAYLQIRGKYEQ